MFLSYQLVLLFFLTGLSDKNSTKCPRLTSNHIFPNFQAILSQILTRITAYMQRAYHSVRYKPWSIKQNYNSQPVNPLSKISGYEISHFFISTSAKQWNIHQVKPYSGVHILYKNPVFQKQVKTNTFIPFYGTHSKKRFSNKCALSALGILRRWFDDSGNLNNFRDIIGR